MTQKTILTLFLLCTLALGCVNPPPSLTRYATACAKNTCFKVELASSEAEVERGLMYRDHLAPDGGMLFIFPKNAVYSIWMKNMLISLDVIWLDENHRVIAINKNMQPCGQGDCPGASPDIPATYVLEVNAGTADTINLSAGDIVDFTIPA